MNQLICFDFNYPCSTLYTLAYSSPSRESRATLAGRPMTAGRGADEGGAGGAG